MYDSLSHAVARITTIQVFSLNSLVSKLERRLARRAARHEMELKLAALEGKIAQIQGKIAEASSPSVTMEPRHGRRSL